MSSIERGLFIMKKFIALVVLLCAVIISSSASATNDQIPHRRSFDELYREAEREKAAKEAEERRFKEEQARQEEFYRLVFTAVLTVGLIAMFFAYKHSKDRQFIREHSLAVWLSSFVGGKNFWLLIFCLVSLVTCIFYVPYNMVHSQKPEFVIKNAHGTIFEIPKDFRLPVTKIDYQAIAFREILILIACCAGYTISIVIKKK